MSSLEELHDHYLKTKPNIQKVQRASQLLIRLCKHLNVSSPKDINPDLYSELKSAVEEYYVKDFHKAIQDKSMIAEMIGRFGPIEGWEKVLENLLNDEDSNLRQFTLQSLEYCGRENLNLIIKYLEKYKDHGDDLMKAVSARVLSRVYSQQNEELLLQLTQQWINNKDWEFLEDFKKRIESTRCEASFFVIARAITKKDNGADCSLSLFA